MERNPYTQPDRDRIALVTIDVQRDTLAGGACEVPGTQEALPQIEAALRAFRRAGELVVHVVRLYSPDGRDAEPVRRPRLERGERMFAPGSDGSQLCKELLPNVFTELDPALLLSGGLQEIAANEFVLYKSRWGAFYRTDLERLLRACNVTTLAVAGCNWPNCPRTTIYEAGERDFRLVVLADAVSGLYDRGAEELRGIGASVAETAAFLDWFERGVPLKTV